MKILLPLVIILLFATSAIAQPSIDSLKIGSDQRSFYFYKPAKKIKKQTVIFIMHGSGGTGMNMIQPAARLQAVADSLGFFLVYPNGYKNYWNECRRYATSLANKEQVNEEAFFEAMLAYFNRQYKTRKDQYFAIGLSGGGHMAYKLAITMPQSCKGITAVVASLPDSSAMDCPPPNSPMAVLIANGTKDGLNKYEGGDIVINGSSWGRMRSTKNTFHVWAGAAGYAGAPVEEKMVDPYPDNGQNITRLSFRDEKKPDVILLSVNGGEHSFPKDLDIFLEAGAFFKRQQRKIRN
ncbi:MAG: poly(3-hydroxybutyrate) depolymerase [Chitinophagaceae bacterium]|nr:MAG: poly(3-hydroxybutyrate) depolymerase [Chitinophagaceae bacterium]